MSFKSLLLLILFQTFSINDASSEPGIKVFDRVADLPRYYRDDDNVKIEENRLVLKPTAIGRLYWISYPRKKSDVVTFDIEASITTYVSFALIDANSTLHYFPMLFYEVKLDTTFRKVRIRETEFAYCSPIRVKITTTGVNFNCPTIDREYPGNFKLNRHYDYSTRYFIQMLIQINGNGKFIFSKSYQLAIIFKDTTVEVPAPPSSVTTTKLISTSEINLTTENVQAAGMDTWLIILGLILDIVICAALGAFSVWLYMKIKDKYYKTPVEVEDSRDEDLETAIEDITLQTAKMATVPSSEVTTQPANPNVNNKLNISQSSSVAPIAASSHGSVTDLRTATPLFASKDQYLPSQEMGSKMPAQKGSKKDGKKSFLEKAGNIFKRKNKEASKKYFFQQPQMSISGFSSSAASQPNFGESKEVIKARAPLSPLPPPKSMEKKKPVKKKSKDADGQECDPTQASREESYLSDVAGKKR